MKKLLSLLLCLSMLCMAASALAYAPGSYTASGDGLMGPVEVTVTFDENAICNRFSFFPPQQCGGIFSNDQNEKCRFPPLETGC